MQAFHIGSSHGQVYLLEACSLQALSFLVEDGSLVQQMQSLKEKREIIHSGYAILNIAMK